MNDPKRHQHWLVEVVDVVAYQRVIAAPTQEEARKIAEAHYREGTGTRWWNSTEVIGWDAVQTFRTLIDIPKKKRTLRQDSALQRAKKILRLSAQWLLNPRAALTPFVLRLNLHVNGSGPDPLTAYVSQSTLSDIGTRSKDA